MTTTVVNIRGTAMLPVVDGTLIYIGRARAGQPENPWGNPFSHLPSSRAAFRVPKDEVLSRYAAWLRDHPELVGRAKRELRGKVLGRFCRRQGVSCPARCAMGRFSPGWSTA